MPVSAVGTCAGGQFDTYIPPCFREGFVAEGIVDVQSNNEYTDGFCIHSNTYVDFSRNNFFADNSVVSMPDINDVGLPATGFSSNIGLQAALRDNEYRIRILDRVPSIIADFYAGGAKYAPDYITNSVLIPLFAKKCS